MNKTFCDICEQPALSRDDLRGLEVMTAFGATRGCNEDGGTWQPSVTAKAIFGFHQHPTGFGGPPDLCRNCAARMLQELAAKLTDR